MKAQKVWFERERIYLLTDDGREASLPVRLFSRLYNASDEQRQHFTLSHFGIHWPDLDEDLSYEGFFDAEDTFEKKNPIGRIFNDYPELNVRQVARSIGINSTLMQQYVDGYKTPSPQRTKQIQEALRRLGRELSKVAL